MRAEMLGLLLTLTLAALASAKDADAADAAAAREQGALTAASDAHHSHSRPARWVVFRPMFAAKAKQQQINRQWRSQELRRQWRAKGHRSRRALHFPQAGGASSGEESGLALRVAVNDLLFQSAPANDLPEPAARRSATGVGPSAGNSNGVGAGLKPMLLARLRAASREREPAAEEEAFLLMSTAGGRPAIVPAPTSRPHAPVHRPHKTHKPSHSTNKTHKQRKGDKQQQQRRRVARDTSPAATATPPARSAPAVATLLGQRLDAMEDAMRQRGDVAERVKKYDAQGVYPAYSYTHGRFTRAAAATAAVQDPVKQVMKVKVHGEEDDEDMETAENVVFRPLFAHRDRHAVRQEAKRRRSGLAKKPTKAAVKPLRRRPAAPAATPVRRPPAATQWFHRRTYLKQYPSASAGRRYQYQYSPYRRVVYYH